MMGMIMITAIETATKLFCEGVATVVTIYGIYKGSKSVKRKKKG